MLVEACCAPRTHSLVQDKKVIALGIYLQFLEVEASSSFSISICLRRVEVGGVVSRSDFSHCRYRTRWNRRWKTFSRPLDNTINDTKNELFRACSKRITTSMMSW
jgi:hypothetical protein